MTDGSLKIDFVYGDEELLVEVPFSLEELDIDGMRVIMELAIEGLEEAIRRGQRL